MTAPIVAIDTETLGLDADVNPIWEIALILPDGTEHCWQQKVSPREIALAHPKALEISGFEERYSPEAAVTRNTSAFRVASLIPSGAHLVGAVVSFDEERLRRLLWAEGFAVPWHYHIIDVEALAVGWVMGRYGTSDEAEAQAVALPWKSTELSLSVGVNPDDFAPKHTALADARWAKAVYDAVMVEP